MRLSLKTPVRLNELVTVTLNNNVLGPDSGIQHLEQLRRKYDFPSTLFFCHLQLFLFFILLVDRGGLLLI